MKNCFKIITVILCFCLCFCACGKSEEDILVEDIAAALENGDFEGFFELCGQAELYELNEDQISAIETHKATVFDLYYEMINEDVTYAKMEEAFMLCEAVLLMDFNEEQHEKISVIKTAIEEMCFAGTFIVRPEYLSDIEVDDVYSYQTLSDVFEKGQSPVFICEYDKRSECQVAFQEYKDYLEQNFTYLGLEVGDLDLITYSYADESGKFVDLTEVDDPEDTHFLLQIDNDFYDILRIDTSDMDRRIKP